MIRVLVYFGLLKIMDIAARIIDLFWGSEYAQFVEYIVTSKFSIFLFAALYFFSLYAIFSLAGKIVAKKQ